MPVLARASVASTPHRVRVEDRTKRNGTPVVTAHFFAKVAKADPPSVYSYGTNLEGASFDRRGNFYFVNTTAQSGEPKIMRLSLRTKKVSSLFTNAASAFTCVVFAPSGAIYVCDLGTGTVYKFNEAQRSLSPVLKDVDGTGVAPDDLAIAPDGTLDVTDYQGTPTNPVGRVISVRPNGAVKVVVSGLAEPNGIAFAAGGKALWLSEDLMNRLDLLALSPFGAPTPALHVAQYLPLGAYQYADSITTDGAGHAYEAIWNGAEVLIYNADGRTIGRVVLPQRARWVTHVAIKPGTRRGFITTAGPGGGYIYTFRALAAATPDQPNGG